MKCSKCGAELPNDANFCSNCGEKFEKTEENSPENTVGNKTQEKIAGFWKKQSLFGKLAIVSLIMFTFFSLVAFSEGRIFAGVLSIIAIAVDIVALLMRKEIIKTPKSWIPLCAVILSFVLVIPFFSLFSINVNEHERYSWKEVVLADMLPKPASQYGDISSNSQSGLYLEVEEISAVDYEKYVEACKKQGFIIDAQTDDNGFCAYNDKGYKLSLKYYDYSERLYIDLKAAMKMEAIVWPNSELVNLIPVPKATTGQIKINEADEFAAYIGNTTIEEYNEYVKACEENGFTVDANKQNKSYTAKNSDSNKLTVNYEGNNTIFVSVTKPEFDITIEIECVENWIFNKYDVELSVDDNFKGTITHGDNESFDVTLKKGKHTISFESVEYETLDGEVEVEISKNETIKLKINCFSSEIKVEVVSGSIVKEEEKTEEPQDSENMAGAPDIWHKLLEKHYEEVKKKFEDAGFTNVTCVAHEIDYDENYVFEGSVVNIAIGENGDICVYEKGEQWPKDIKIQIDYRVKPAKTTPDTPQIVLPQADSKLGKDIDTKGTSTIYYINTDNISNTPSIATWGKATVTDGVAEYLQYLQSQGFNVIVTDTAHKEPYSGFHTYDTKFKISNDKISWTMDLYIQKEKYIEYELDIHIN